MCVYLFNVHCQNAKTMEVVLYIIIFKRNQEKSRYCLSFVYDFLISIIINGMQYKEDYLLSDSTEGQNKNKVVTTFFSWLAMELGLTGTHLFSVISHSFVQCDRNFLVCGLKVKVEEKVHNLATYVNLLNTARKNPCRFIVRKSAPLFQKWSDGFNTKMKKKITI